MTTHGEGVPAQPIDNELPLPAGVTAASPWIRLGAVVLESVLVVVTLGIGWVIWALMIVGRGQTPAKALLNQRVIDTGSLKPVGFARMFWVPRPRRRHRRGLCDPLDTRGAAVHAVLGPPQPEPLGQDLEHIRSARPERRMGHQARPPQLAHETL